MPKLPPAGFYGDPDDPSRERWWNGTAWGNWTRPAGSTKEEEAPAEPAGPEASGLYAVLGVHADASAEEIKRAYREKARLHHPDAGGDAAAFKEISHAYEVLSNPRRRVRYDGSGEQLDEKQPSSYSGVKPDRVGAFRFGRDAWIFAFWGSFWSFTLGSALSFWIGGSWAACLFSWGRYETTCGSLLDSFVDIVTSPRSLLSAVVLLTSAAPLVWWLAGTLRSKVWRKEFFKVARFIVAIYVAGLAAAIGTFVVAFGQEWWRFVAAAATWVAGYAPIFLILRGQRRLVRLYGYFCYLATMAVILYATIE